MKITLLGTGTSQGIPVIGCDCEVCSSLDPRDQRLRSSIMISQDDTNIVIDTGPDFRTQMLQNQVNSVDAVLFTHEHNDHTAGLDDLRPFIFRQRREMPIYGAHRVIENIKDRFNYAFSTNPYPGAPRLISNTIEHGLNFNIKGIDIMPIEVMHGSLSVLAFRVGSFTYVTDANYISKESLKLIQGTKILIINALHKKEHYSHFSLDQALEIIKIIKPEKCYLTHISHSMGLTKDWQSLLPKNVYASTDSLNLEVNYLY